ncbi:MAG: helitron helicase-like domain-containing protein [Defluviitaleaceae bacterium]|nr:helitron helicase-like domain-containing protein [Defluviitaleaceae bacterium]
MNETEKKVTITKVHNPVPVEKYWKARVTEMNHIVEIMTMAREPIGQTYVKMLPNNQYMLLETGEIRDCKNSEHRGESIQSTKRSLRKMRQIINNNFTGAPNELFITLTYADNMTDVKRLYRDFEVFIKRFKRKYEDFDYINIVEPQGRGAWHCHVLLRLNTAEKAYINNNDVIAPMWGHGFTKTTNLTEVDNIGAYLTAYLSDMEITNDTHEVVLENIGNHTTVVEKVIKENGQSVKKRILKGGRLCMYPPSMNLYRCSRGIIKPDVEVMEYWEAKTIVGNVSPDYQKQIAIAVNDQPINAITYEQYNLKRVKHNIRSDKDGKENKHDY